MSLDILSHIELDMKRPNTAVVYATQYDTVGRIQATLLNDGVAWNVPSGSMGMVSFRKTDSIGGFYDTTETGIVAVSVDQTDANVIYIALDTQTMTTATPTGQYVQMQVNFYNNEGQRLSTFAFHLSVQAAAISDPDVRSQWTFRILTEAFGQVIKNQEDAIEWMEENIRTQAGYVVDDTLKVEGAAGDAKKIGELFNSIIMITDTQPSSTDYPWNRIWVDPDNNDVEIPVMDDLKTAGLLAGVESTSTASKAYAVGEYLLYNNVCYRVTAAIASGGTITVGTNVVAEKIPTRIAETGDEIRRILNDIYPVNLYSGGLTAGLIKTSDGSVGLSTSGRYTDYVDVGDYTKIVYTRIHTTSSSALWGCAFYDSSKAFINGSGQGPILNDASYGYLLQDLTVPFGAKYARFTWNSNITDPFAVYDYDQYQSAIQTKVESLKDKYTGKKLSILGDSISTFVPTADKVDGKAPTGCTTTYPGNVTQYQNSDVSSVDDTWWGKVLNHFGMALGINESWAGSTIGYNSSYTSSGKYTADNCLCSETRIGHLDENGTPDLIIVFGGTNDINHHMSGNNVRFAVGQLDSTHNPYDFDNFPMITDTYYGSITTMLLRIQHSYPNATILMLLPYFCTYTHTSSGDIATPKDQNDFCNAAIDVCNFLGVEYFDLRKIINLYDVSSLLFDGLHPKANGMTAIAKAVIHKLNNML